MYIYCNVTAVKFKMSAAHIFFSFCLFIRHDNIGVEEENIFGEVTFKKNSHVKRLLLLNKTTT